MHKYDYRAGIELKWTIKPNKTKQNKSEIWIRSSRRRRRRGKINSQITYIFLLTWYTQHIIAHAVLLDSHGLFKIKWNACASACKRAIYEFQCVYHNHGTFTFQPSFARCFIQFLAESNPPNWTQRKKAEKNKQMRWRTIEYKDENCTRKKWYHRFVNQFLFSPKTVTILWKCDGRFNSDLYERFHIEKVCGPRGMSRMNLTVLNVHISQRTNRHAHIC